ncbi:hypothetical protein F5B22DRAFT_638725 [Xylaria bambusicola]|uniref:uncharacterized protein n=1 Tax=Xylaria bambusicola TaxID=326684 RepID=UPI0020076DB7|nr:uncharacterized protein F5B22DRAFT_638725 [Xylaria bambusicola]KAI0508518.1 hypothetical protein F5B22DRAFT_638725 [Xylaria bambusicola]
MFSRHRTHTPPSGSKHHHHHHHRHHHHHHHDSHHSSDAPRERPSVPEQESRHDPPLKGLIQIDLLDIDAPATGRLDIKIGVKRVHTLDHIAKFLRAKFGKDACKVCPDDQIEFFHAREQLRGGEIPDNVSTLWYRVQSPRDDGLFKVTWKKGHYQVQLSQQELNNVAQAIESGATLGQLRSKVASFLRIVWELKVEPDQVIIEALGGFRPGPVEGDNWECTKLRKWLCSHLSVSLVQPHDFFIFCGYNERYVLHRPSLGPNESVFAYYIKKALKNRILTTISESGDRPSEIRTRDINLYQRGKSVKDNASFSAGKAFDFTLSRDVEGEFIQAEAWLLPLTETCSICADEKRVSEMPAHGRITGNCQHKATACKDCVSQWITSSMESVAWDRLRCPECPQMLEFKDVENFATKDIFTNYDRLATKAVLESVKGFRWCLNPKCNAGEIFPSTCQKAKCHVCQNVTCARHNIPWHRGETCDQYDKRTRAQQKSARLSEKHIKKIARPCPGCKKNINKYAGCDHVTCVCGHEWCWLCFAPYTKDKDMFLECKHKPECRYFKRAPDWEGRRAFLRALNGVDIHPPFRERPAFARPIQRPGPGDAALIGVVAEAEAQAIRAAAEARAVPNRPESPEPRPPANLFDVIMENDNHFVDDERRRHGMPFMNDALLFNIAQLITRNR